MKSYVESGSDWEVVGKHIRFACCDCGLVHDIQVRIRDGQVEWRWQRNNRSTALIRRHQKVKNGR